MNMPDLLVGSRSVIDLECYSIWLSGKCGTFYSPSSIRSGVLCFRLIEFFLLPYGKYMVFSILHTERDTTANKLSNGVLQILDFLRSFQPKSWIARTCLPPWLCICWTMYVVCRNLLYEVFFQLRKIFNLFVFNQILKSSDNVGRGDKEVWNSTKSN